jgi:hypothetical protein
MKGDFSRSVRELDATTINRFAGVLHQQGRVWLDSDWNADVYNRLHVLQQETIDIIGACGAPAPGTGFQISANPDPTKQDDFLIAAGRYYVDGILCQLASDVSYLTQPDYPDAPAISMPTQGNDVQALIYLEVWQRLITYLEEPLLREIALGGPDTATRIRTVAQVKVLTVPNGPTELTCANAPLPATGQGTLTTLQPTNTQPDDLCRLPDPANYTGRENHLYRVEIHDGGDVPGGSAGFAFSNQPLAQDAPAGSKTLVLQKALLSNQVGALMRSGLVTVTDNSGQMETVTVASIDNTNTTLTLATALVGSYTLANHASVSGGVARFKWSRDNASFAVAVTAVGDPQTLTLASLGRDQATALRQGDIVEISDDASDLGPASGFLTYLSADPDPDLFTATIASPLPTEFQVARHLKLRRWDGLGWANATFDPAATPDMDLGDGVHIQFGGSDLRAGDYWQFTARSADGSVEALTNAPTTGILRHYCPLAIAHWSYTTLYSRVTVGGACDAAGISGGVLTAILSQLQQSGQAAWDAATIEAAARFAGATADQIQALDKALAGQKGESQLTLTVTDCRQPFHPLTEPCCDCTVTVAPGDSLSAAFDKISGVGGIVCLLPGIHELTDTVLVSAKNGLTVRGAGAATIINAPSIAVALRFVGCINLTLRDLTIKSLQPGIVPGQPGSAAGSQPAGPGATASAGQVRPASGGGIDGVVTFIDCQAVRMIGCIVAGAALSTSSVRACISSLSSELTQQVQLQSQSLLTSGDTPQSPQAAGASSAGKKKGKGKEPQPQPPSLSSEAKSATGSPGDARSVQALSALAAGANFGLSLDFTLRDCRLYAGSGQFGLMVVNSFGVSVEDNWFFPLTDLDPTGLNTVFQRVNQRGGAALSFIRCQAITVMHNLVVGFDSVLSANEAGRFMSLHKNVGFECGNGFNIVSTGPSNISDNVLEMDAGPVILINSDFVEAVLKGNYLSLAPAAARSPQVGSITVSPPITVDPQVVLITADTATLSDNYFENLVELLLSSVGVTANRISYTSNRSYCSNLPNIADVILLGPTKNEQITGSIVAVGNTCVEPLPADVTGLESTLKESLIEQASLVNQYMTTKDPKQRQQLLQQLEALSSQEQNLAQALEKQVASRGGPFSLLASAAFTVTSMNLLSNGLLRMGFGSDQGSVAGVS